MTAGVYFSPALRSAAIDCSLFEPVTAFSHLSTENFGFILSTSSASARASSRRPDWLYTMVIIKRVRKESGS